MSDTITTVKIRSAPLSQPTEVQLAQNAFAVAVKRYTEQPTPENQVVLETTRQELERVQDLYREGRKLRLEFARGRMLLQTGRRS